MLPSDSDEPILEPEDTLRAASPSPAEMSQHAHSAAPHDAYAALRFRDYRLYSLGGLLAALGGQMFSLAVGWELYQRTRDVWTLGLVGLIQALPVIFLALPAGDLADRFDRRRIVLWMEFFIALGWLGFVFLSLARAPVSYYFALLFIDATLGAFAGPARSALLPQLVPEAMLANAITWNASRWQTAATLGPALGGAAIAIFHGATMVYLLSALCAFSLFACLLPLRPRPHVRPKESESAWHRLLVGLRFVRGQKIILATITLDLFAVFLGGAVTLLPAFADEILKIGPAQLGWLRAAPAAGALGMSLWLSLRPPMRRAGASLLWCVIGFGIATIVFALSRNFALSLLALAITGALDNVSVVVRSTLLQVLTPPHMRGRVSAVNSVFVGSSNELGGFESGAAARLLGLVNSVVLGGIGTILVVLGVHFIWPQVAKLGALDELVPDESAEKSTPE